MLVLQFTTLSFLLALEATAWPMMRLFQTDDNSTDTGSNDSGSDQPEGIAGMESAMKAFAFNFGYTALSANSSCGGKLYPCIELVVSIG